MVRKDDSTVMVSYTIQPGDTYWELAYRYNTTVEEIIAANPGVDYNQLYVGQVIVIPDPPAGHGHGPGGHGYGRHGYGPGYGGYPYNNPYYGYPYQPYPYPYPTPSPYPYPYPYHHHYR